MQELMQLCQCHCRLLQLICTVALPVTRRAVCLLDASPLSCMSGDCMGESAYHAVHALCFLSELLALRCTRTSITTDLIMTVGRCAVCSEPLLATRNIIAEFVLPCGHSYCNGCLTEALLTAKDDASLLPMRCCGMGTDARVAQVLLQPADHEVGKGSWKILESPGLATTIQV